MSLFFPSNVRRSPNLPHAVPPRSAWCSWCVAFLIFPGRGALNLSFFSSRSFLIASSAGIFFSVSFPFTVEKTLPFQRGPKKVCRFPAPSCADSTLNLHAPLPGLLAHFRLISPDKLEHVISLSLFPHLLPCDFTKSSCFFLLSKHFFASSRSS